MVRFYLRKMSAMIKSYKVTWREMFRSRVLVINSTSRVVARDYEYTDLRHVVDARHHTTLHLYILRYTLYLLGVLNLSYRSIRLKGGHFAHQEIQCGRDYKSWFWTLQQNVFGLTYEIGDVTGAFRYKGLPLPSIICVDSKQAWYLMDKDV
ncbi:hypothetical protein RF11_14727 [Thelohanellus kitauei]|uniref:Uncharacterized protein n=1 Tax=Thelohanellus kitauei TaxID=669202 RepID=A0A0C2MGI5_THEKT|nr:hypothetical protein RF11_14727 [Thelohanellus kitauei]